MKILIEQEGIQEMQKVLDENADKPQNIRVYITQSGCCGPSVGLCLDEKEENDLKDDANGINFIMGKDVYEKLGDIKIDYTPKGFILAPIHPPESNCGSCGCGCE